MGNYLRFVNHDLSQLNAVPVYVPYKNRWYVLYIAENDIHVGDEIFTYYGDDYFKDRNIDL